MQTLSGDLPSEVHASMELEDVFLEFLKKFESLPQPRSVAEAKITDVEIDALRRWFSQQWGRPRMWCEDTFQSQLASGIFASPQEMFGALLLILASEVCRTTSNEDSVWPAVTAVLKADTVSFPALFAGGQPTTACKNALAAGSRRLNLRNLIDRYGAQEYFDTLKLSFGFTFRGAVRKLPQWLDGLGVPIAVRILTGAEPEYGDLRSNSFADLWKALQDFRRGLISVERMSVLLQDSLWVRPEWIPELTRVARLRAPRPQITPDSQQVLDRSIEPVSEIVLRWEYPSRPELSLHLHEEPIYEILGEAETAMFVIDGRVVDRWTRQEGGGWRGRRDLPCQPPGVKVNLRPKLLSISSEGSLLEEVDLLEMGTAEPLQVFDLKLGTQLSLESRLSPTRDYALICDADISVPDAPQCLKLKDRAAYRLTSPWPTDLSAMCAGKLFWQPRIEQREAAQAIRLTLESLPGESVEIGSACIVNVIGVPQDATLVSLVAGGAAYSMNHRGIAWQTSRPVQITLAIALDEERVRVCVTGPDYARTVTPRSSLRLRGIAAFESESNADAEPRWTLLDRHRPLNRADGSGRARVFVEASSSQLFEGSRFVGKVSTRGLQMRDLCGWGAPLIVRAEHAPDTAFVEAVEDYGRGRFLPPLFRRTEGAFLSWQTPTPPSSGHQILVWSDLSQEPRRLSASEVFSQKDDTLWRLPSLGSVAFMAVAYNGARSASFAATEPAINALRTARSPALFALFRWLKLPILNLSFRSSMQEAIFQVPVEFVRGWLGDEALPYGLVHRQAEQGLDAVIREFFWNYKDRNETRLERLAQAFAPEASAQSEAESFKSSLSRLGEICPSLCYRLAGYKLRSDKYRKYVRAVAAAMLHQPPGCPQLRVALAGACRECASLVGIAPEILQANVDMFGAYLDNQVPTWKQAEPELRRLGETSGGRQFLTASLLLRLVERKRF
jgi:hypothetical protein